MWRTIIMFLTFVFLAMLTLAEPNVVNVIAGTIFIVAVIALTAFWAVPEDLAMIRRQRARGNSMDEPARQSTDKGQ